MSVKPPKYLYFIIVDLNNVEVLKFGVSNNYERRFKEYKKNDIEGKFIKLIAVYKTTDAKKLETALKWYCKQFYKPVWKQEYFDLINYKKIMRYAMKLCKIFNWKIKKIL